MVAITSVGGLLALLDEQDDDLRFYALQKLNELVDSFWHEISDSVGKLEILHESENFRFRELAALVASKVYYHLGEYDDSVTFALGAGNLFEINVKSQYVETLVTKCIDRYIQLRQERWKQEFKAETKPVPFQGGKEHSERRHDKIISTPIMIDSRLANIVDRMFERCYLEGAYKQAIGIALESRRLDKLHEILLKSESQRGELLNYTLQLAMNHVDIRDFRNRLLRKVLLPLYKEQMGAQPDYISMCQCLVYLKDADSLAEIFKTLVECVCEPMNSEIVRKVLLAYQIAFDLDENAGQELKAKVWDILMCLFKLVLPLHRAAFSSSGEPTKMGGGASGGTQETPTSPLTETTPGGSSMPLSTSAHESTASSSTHTSTFLSQPDHLSAALYDTLKRLRWILSGEAQTRHQLDFLVRHNRSDSSVVKVAKAYSEPKHSALLTSMITAHGFVYAGTACDVFLRENLDYVARGANFARMAITASLGVIYKGHMRNAYSLLASYLPRANYQGSPYTESGALYALGLIFANHGHSVLPYLLTQAKATSNEIVQHGAVLGVGIAGFGLANEEVYETLKTILYSDSALAGEAAAVAMGLAMCGNGSGRALEEMLQYARETQHEKIIRGLSVGIALCLYNREEEADPMIDLLHQDKDSILRYGAMLSVAVAYAGTGSNRAICRLLHVAVSDVNDDVRRAAVISLGFVLCRTPAQVPKVVQLLSVSFNPHVRYGSALALGIACAGTGLREAIELLEPLLQDHVDYVRQGAMIAMALVFQLQNDVSCGVPGRVRSFRAQLEKCLKEKPMDVMAKVGAILSLGILDIGGRNAKVSLLSRSGQISRGGVVGTMLFAQYWYWYPFLHFLSLALQPSCLIALDESLRMPKVKFNCTVDAREWKKWVREREIRNKPVIPNANLAAPPGMMANAVNTLMGLATGSLGTGTNVSGSLPTLSPSTTITGSQLFSQSLSEHKGSVECLFAYYPQVMEMKKNEKADEEEVTSTPILSSSARHRSKKREKIKKTSLNEVKETKAMEIEPGSSTGMDGAPTNGLNMAFSTPTITSYTVENLSRVVPHQLPYLKWPIDESFVPISNRLNGIIMLQRTGHLEYLNGASFYDEVETDKMETIPDNVVMSEPTPPEEFEFTE